MGPVATSTRKMASSCETPARNVHSTTVFLHFFTSLHGPATFNKQGAPRHAITRPPSSSAPRDLQGEASRVSNFPEKKFWEFSWKSSEHFRKKLKKKQKKNPRGGTYQAHRTFSGAQEHTLTKQEKGRAGRVRDCCCAGQRAVAWRGVVR